MNFSSILAGLKRLIWCFDNPIHLGSNSDSPSIHSGNGIPNGLVSAPLGSTYTDRLTGLQYRKSTVGGTTGWVELGSGDGSGSAEGTTYDNTTSASPATNVQDAIDDLYELQAGVPTLIRRTYLIRPGVSGVTGGTVDDVTAAANLAAMQAIVDAADENGGCVQMDQESVEIAGGPLIIRGTAGGVIWDSPTFARITQRTDNVAVLQIGDPSTTCQNLDFSGINLHYLNDQAGNTDANACVIYNQWKSRIGKIQVASTITNARPYRGIYMPQSQTIFSCHFHNLFSFQAHYSLLHISNFGTGNVYENIYLSGVGSSGTAQTVASPFRWDMNGTQMHDSVFNQLNLEWCITNQLMRFSNVRGPVINSLHVEANQLSGAGASFFYSSISNVQMNGVLMLDNRIQNSLVTDSIPAIFKYFNAGRFNVATLFWIQNTPSYVDMPYYLHFQADTDGFITQPARTTIQALTLTDATGTSLRDNLRVDRNMGGVDMNGADWGNMYILGSSGVSAGGAMTRVLESDRRIDVSKTVYGQETIDGTVTIPGAIASPITITLSDRMGPPSSRWATAPVPDGSIIGFCRGGPATNNAIIANHDGTTIGTFADAGGSARLNFVMVGGDWTPT